MGLSQDVWAIIFTTAVGVIINASVQMVSAARTRGEFRSVMRNFPPHRHQNGAIAYSAEYPPAEFERPR